MIHMLQSCSTSVLDTKKKTRKTGSILPCLYTQFSFKIRTTLRLILPFLPLPSRSLARGYGAQQLSALPLLPRSLAQGHGALEERKEWLVSLAETSQKSKTLTDVQRICVEAETAQGGILMGATRDTDRPTPTT